MTRLTNPRPLFLDVRGALLDGGKVYVGTSGADPEASPISVFWDAAMTIPALQPLRTLGGVIVNGASPGLIFFAEADASLTIRTSDDELVDYLPSISMVAAVAYQPEDADLTAIAALATTSFGRNLLTLANAAALKAAAGIVDGLPTTGGTVTGAIVRSGAGVYRYAADPAITGGRDFYTPAAGADPTSQPGDVWYGY
jgi:hypothetical protein